MITYGQLVQIPYLVMLAGVLIFSIGVVMAVATGASAMRAAAWSGAPLALLAVALGLLQAAAAGKADQLVEWKLPLQLLVVIRLVACALGLLVALSRAAAGTGGRDCA